ncbi:MAG: phenylalanine--tRNA ligase subunit beta, partial [Lachnospiraceae bacterium]|nr:phenylalanine--tRNA ligase subunit beta [Lachnospiraceae bacterium]
SPAWMRRRLSLVGINAISNMVDITNYVLRELGQPMHAFDDAFLQGNEIVVRRAEEGEPIVTLDEKEFKLNPENLVICDGNRPVALAGIMGGLNSEIRDTTTAVTFEAAKFVRDNVRKSSRALGQASDSSAVFSKGVNEYTTVMAMKRALHLTEELGCGRVSKTHIDVNSGNSIERRELKVSVKRVNGVLGITVPDEAIADIMKRLDFEPELSGDELTIKIPAYREDMEAYQDVAEEVIRMYGYDHVKPTFMSTAKVTSGGRNIRQKALLKLREAIAAAGACEAIHYSFFSPADLNLLKLPADAPERHAIRLINPINEDLSLMRTTLAPQMLYAIQRNQKRGTISGRLFEVGKVFIPGELPLTDYPEERDTLCIGVFGEEESFFTLKGLADIVADAMNVSFRYAPAENTYLHPYRTAAVLLDGEKIGMLGQLRYEIADELDLRTAAYILELDLAPLSKYYNSVKKFSPLPKFDVEKRDFAFVTDRELSCESVEDTIRGACEYVTDVKLFDVYEGMPLPPKKKSMAFSVVFTPRASAFTEKDIEGFTGAILDALNVKYGVVLRS